MRTAFLEALTTLAAEDRRVTLVVGDLGYSVVERFAARFPTQYLNAGVAEQNMTGMAAGLALGAGRCVFTYSIGNFPTIRCLEQVRNDVCYHQADVKVVALGGGVAYGPQGYTHHAVEDLAVMRALPTVVVAAPADAHETRAITQLATSTPGPWYIRLGRDREPLVHDGVVRVTVGTALSLRPGTDGAVFSTGAITYEAMLAVDQLASEGVRVRLYSVPFVQPLDTVAVLRAAAEVPWVATVEEHRGPGGLGSAVAEVLAERGGAPPLLRLHLPDHIDRIGSGEYLRRSACLDAQGIAARLRTRHADAVRNAR